MVAAGLTSSPHMISASLTALSRLMFDFHQDLDRMTVDELLSTVTVFLKSNTREIVKSSMGFVKVCIAVLSHQTIEAYLPSLVPSLCGWGTEHKNHFNLKVRHIFERLIRKFGYENVEQYVPEDDKKLVQNIRKKQLRAKRRKGDQPDAGEGDDNIEQEEMAKPRAGMKSAYDEAVYGSESEMGDSSDDDDDHKPAAKGKQQQQKKGKKDRNGTAFLQEGGDMPMDLLDQDQLDKVTVKNPRKGGKQQKGPQVEFEKDASGRMVINEDGDEDGEGGGESTNAYLEAIAGEDGFHRTTKGGLKSNKGRKRSRQEEDDDRWVDEIEGKMRLDDGESSGKKKKAKKQQIGSEVRCVSRSQSHAALHSTNTPPPWYSSKPRRPAATSRKTVCLPTPMCLWVKWLAKARTRRTICRSQARRVAGVRPNSNLISSTWYMYISASVQKVNAF